MAKHQCPFPNCTYATNDITDELAAVMLKIHAEGTHLASASSQKPARVESVRRPVISAGGTNEEWAYFQTRWDDYKAATQITGIDIIIQLLECCEEDLRKDITRAAGGTLTHKSEEEVLNRIKALAVRRENIMVARVELHDMQQDEGEPIRSFAARVKGQADVCNFVIDCPSCSTTINYTSKVLRDIIVKGILDNEIQLDLLSEDHQEMSLEDMIRYVEAKESGKRSANKLSQSLQAASTSRSQYKKIKPFTTTSDLQCTYCGKSGHGRSSPLQVRKKQCPAFGKICSKCGIPNHLAQLCRRRLQFSKSTANKSSPIENMDEMTNECPVWEELCGVQCTEDIKVSCSVIAHHIFEGRNKGWIKKQSKPQPFIQLTASINIEDYKDFGVKLTIKGTQKRIQAVADTGCQSCLAGYNFARQLGFNKSLLIPVNLKMSAANKSNINVLGAVIVRFSGQNKRGKTVESRQLVYITDSTDKVYLSREACVDLGLIQQDFPLLGGNTVNQGNVVNEQAVHALAKNPTNDLIEKCGCPKRSLPPKKPQRLPFDVHDDKDVDALKVWILDYYKSSSFNTCPHQRLPKMHGPPMRLMIDKNATPPDPWHTPIPVPLYWQDEVKAGLDQDVQLGVIRPVPIGEPVTWCHRMVVCPKKNGRPRRTVDLQELNKFAARETHHTQSPYLQARSVPSGKLKTVFDCWNGYHSIPLHKDDHHYTTFITPWGRYQYMVAPQGYIASGDGYCRRFDEIVAHIPNKTKCIDDTLLWADTIEQSFNQAIEWLDICGKNGIILNPEKFVFAKSSVDFAGFTITDESVKPAAKYLSAIQQFPTPANLTDIRSWFGLINQVAYAFGSANVMKPFRKLLKGGEKFHWDEELEKIFQQSKSVIIRQIQNGVRIFEKSRATCLVTDWSRTGVGYWLIQKHCDCQPIKPFCCPVGWKITLVGSRFTSTAESRYSPIEGEALAVVYALNHARHFVLGCNHLLVAVDHKPLLPVLGGQPLEKMSNRLRNLKEKTLRYRFKMIYISGLKNRATDAVSRRPVGTLDPPQLQLSDSEDCSTTSQNETAAATEIQASFKKSDLFDFLLTVRSVQATTDVAGISALHSMNVITWDKVKLETSSDQDMENLMECVEAGFSPCKSEIPHNLHEFFPYRHHLTVQDGVVLYKGRIVIPKSLRPDVLQLLHCAHQGVSTMISRAQVSVFWPGITADIHQTRDGCAACNRMMPSQPQAPPSAIHYPVYPFQKVCADFFTYKGRRYLIIVDRYTNWLSVERANEGSKGLVNCLRGNFSTFGIPEELASDGGPEFVSKTTRKFLEEWGVHHRISSVAYPHSNCRAEIGVKTAKRIISDNTGHNGDLELDSFRRAILSYRNNPSPETGISPARCLFGRPIRDFIPIPQNSYRPHHTWSDTLDKREDALRIRHQRMLEKWSEHTQSLPALKVSDHVRIQNQIGNAPRKWDKTGVVVEVRQHNQYLVKTDGSNRVTLRNRKFLRRFEPMVSPKPRIKLADRLKMMPGVDFRHVGDHTHRTVGSEPVEKEKDNALADAPSMVVQTPEHIAPRSPTPQTNTRQKTVKEPLALRQLRSYNKKGLKED